MPLLKKREPARTETLKNVGTRKREREGWRKGQRGGKPLSFVYVVILGERGC